MTVSSWTDPTTQVDGTVIDQTTWNDDLVENIKRILELNETKELENNSGGTLSAGDVVIFDSTKDTAVTTTTTAQAVNVAGVVGATSILAGAKDRITFLGFVASVKVQGNVTRGNFLETSTTATRAQDAGASKKPSTFAIALTGYAGGGAGTVSAMLLLSNQAGDLPSNGVAYTTDASAPLGYTEYTAARGRYIVGVPSGGTVAGTSGTALTDLESRPVGQHNHAITDPGHAHTTNSHNSSATGANITETSTTSSTVTTGSATTGITIDNAGAVIGTNAPYIQLLGIIKD